MSMRSYDHDPAWIPLTAHQREELEKAYDRYRYPNHCVRQELSLTLNLSKIRVYNWFKGRRVRTGETRRRNYKTAPNRQTTNLGSTLDPPIATSSQSSTDGPSELVNSWTIDPTVSTYSTSSHSNLLLRAASLYEQSPHYNSLPSTVDPYETLSGQQIKFGNPFMRSTQQLPPTSGAYVTFSGQYTPSMPEIQQFADGQHFECGCPPLGCGEFAGIVDEMYNMYCTSGVPNEEDLNEPNNIFYFGN